MRALAFVNRTDICMEYAKAAVNDILTAKANIITPERVLTYVSQKYNIQPEDILGKRKTDDIVTARQVAIYLLRELTKCRTLTSVNFSTVTTLPLLRLLIE